MSLKRKEKKVNDHVEKAVHFFIACKANAATSLSTPATMRAKGFGCQGHGSNHCLAGAPQVSQKKSQKHSSCWDSGRGCNAGPAEHNKRSEVSHERLMAAGALAPHIVGQGHDQWATEARGEEEDKGGRGRQQQGRTTTTVPFLKQSSGNKKA